MPVARREAALLLARFLDRDEAWILAHAETTVDEALAERFRAAVERRRTGTPFAHLTGEREFFGLSFDVDDRVLVPRPETEHLVSTALGLHPPPRRILDVGTGSGCLAIALATHLPAASVVATDLSPAALAVARRNVVRFGLSDRIRLVAADLCHGLDATPFDLVVTNPPYIPTCDLPELPPEVRADPPLALDGGPDGLRPLDRLLRALDLPSLRLHLLCEIGYGQSEDVEALAARLGWRVIRFVPDYAGIPRVAVCRRC